MSSNAPRVDRTSSLSKAVDLGGCFVFILRHLGEREEFYRTRGMKSGFHYAFIKGWIFGSHLSILVGSINSESLLKMHKKCMKSCMKLGFVCFYCMGFI